MIGCNNIDYWIEWREAINQDADLSYSLCNAEPVGSLVDSLLIRVAPSNNVSESFLVAAVPRKHEFWLPNGIRIVHGEKSGDVVYFVSIF
jgi:hypothetical protein